MEQDFNPVGLIVTVTALSFLPLIAVTATSFLKISAVLLILRNAIGVQQVPSNLVLYGISMVLSMLVMGPVLTDAGKRFAPDGQFPQSGVQILEAIERSTPPFKKFMLQNTDAKYLQAFHGTAKKFQEKYEGPEVGVTDLFVVMPAFVASELADAFRMGVYLYLPFVVIDLVVSSALMALGMMMVSPMSLTIPIKVVLFVAVEGWSKVMTGLINSYLG
ncbi:MAG: type III secretion system export apparatus subunit SctR [Limnobacter sp.]|nr:type III secretion system export apparatus subunit SctR [Limnobacter sp.]